jgi:FtsH-binding integral membrane protein
MFDWKLIILSAFVMLFFEYFILLRIYQRNEKLEKISLIAAPIMVVIALILTQLVQRIFFKKDEERINPLLLFVIFGLIELPLSLYGYQIKPEASIIERMIVAATFGLVSVLISYGILTYIK